jgi:hypothetical protein
VLAEPAARKDARRAKRERTAGRVRRSDLSSVLEAWAASHRAS